SAVGIAAAEIARADLPDDVAAMFAMIWAESALAGVVREPALGGALVERPNGVWAQRTEAHGGHVEHGSAVGHAAVGPADGDAERVFRGRARRHRVADEFVAVLVDVVLRAERPLVERELGALVDDRALVAAEGSAVLFALEEVLAYLRANLLEDEAQVRRDRIVAQDRVALLEQVAHAERGEAAEHGERDRQPVKEGGVRIKCADEDGGDGKTECQDDETRRERQDQSAHGIPPEAVGIAAAARIAPPRTDSILAKV